MSRKIIGITGIILAIIGLLGGWQLLAEVTGYDCLNRVTKDQISVFFGLTWFWIWKSERSV